MKLYIKPHIFYLPIHDYNLSISLEASSQPLMVPDETSHFGWIWSIQQDGLMTKKYRPEFPCPTAPNHLRVEFWLNGTSVTPDGGVWGLGVATSPPIINSELNLSTPSHSTTAVIRVRESIVEFKRKIENWRDIYVERIRSVFHISVMLTSASDRSQ